MRTKGPRSKFFNALSFKLFPSWLRSSFSWAQRVANLNVYTIFIPDLTNYHTWAFWKHFALFEPWRSLSSHFLCDVVFVHMLSFVSRTVSLGWQVPRLRQKHVQCWVLVRKTSGRKSGKIRECKTHVSFAKQTFDISFNLPKSHGLGALPAIFSRRICFFYVLPNWENILYLFKSYKRWK